MGSINIIKQHLSTFLKPKPLINLRNVKINFWERWESNLGPQGEKKKCNLWDKQPSTNQNFMWVFISILLLRNRLEWLIEMLTFTSLYSLQLEKLSKWVTAATLGSNKLLQQIRRKQFSLYSVLYWTATRSKLLRGSLSARWLSSS